MWSDSPPMSQQTDNQGSEVPSIEERLNGLFEPFHRGDTPGFVVGIAKDGETLYRRAFGLASVAQGVANTPRTRMRIGSTGKHITALATMLLVEEDKIDLEATIDQYIPELPELDGYPTVRQLLNHTGGLRCTQELAFIAAGLTVQPEGKILSSQKLQSRANFPPGDGQLYCNSGYHLVSRVIERTSKLSFAEFLRHRIFEPLGLNDTLAVSSDMPIIERMADLHLPRPDGSLRRGILVNEETLGEGCIVSTLDDMMKWASVLRGPDRPIGSDEAWRQILDRTTLCDDSQSTYGLGIWRFDYRGVEIISHAGGVIGGNSQVLVVPSAGLEVVVLTNTDSIPSSYLALQTIDTLLEEKLVAPPTPVSSEKFKHLVGHRYHSDSGLVWGFEEVGGLLAASLQLSPAAPVLFDFGDRISTRFEDLAMGPFAFDAVELLAGEDNTAPEILTIREAGRPQEFKLMTDDAADGIDPEALVGRYQSADLDCDATVRLDDGLTMRLAGGFGARELDLEVLSETVVGVTASDPIAPTRYAMTVIREGTEVRGFHISTNRARHIEFDRCE